MIYVMPKPVASSLPTPSQQTFTSMNLGQRILHGLFSGANSPTVGLLANGVSMLRKYGSLAL